MFLKCFTSQKESKKRFVFMAGGEGPDPKAAAEAAEGRKEGVKTELAKNALANAEVMKAVADKHIGDKKLDSGDTKKDADLKEAAKKLVTINDKEFQDTVAYAAKRGEVLAIAGMDKGGVNLTKTAEINTDQALATEVGYMQKLKDFSAQNPANAEIKADQASWGKLVEAKIQDIQKQVDGYYERTITMNPDRLISGLAANKTPNLIDLNVLVDEVVRIEQYRGEHFANSTDGAKAKLDGIGKNKIVDINKALAAAVDKMDPALKEQAKRIADANVNFANATNKNLEGTDKEGWLAGAKEKLGMEKSRLFAIDKWQELRKGAPNGDKDSALKPFLTGGDKYADWTKAEALSKTNFIEAQKAYDKILGDYRTVLNGFNKAKEAPAKPADSVTKPTAAAPENADKPLLKYEDVLAGLNKAVKESAGKSLKPLIFGNAAVDVRIAANGKPEFKINTQPWTVATSEQTAKFIVDFNNPQEAGKLSTPILTDAPLFAVNQPDKKAKDFLSN